MSERITLYGIVNIIYFGHTFFGITWYLDPDRTIVEGRDVYTRQQLVNMGMVRKEDILKLYEGSYVEMHNVAYGEDE